MIWWKLAGGLQFDLVRSIGLRFLEVEIAFGARVQIPGRSITSLVNYHDGYGRCIGDIATWSQLLDSHGEVAGKSICERIFAMALELVRSFLSLFPRILLTLSRLRGRRQPKAGVATYVLNFVSGSVAVCPSSST